MLNEWCGYKINLINLINMNIEINIETLLFGIDIYILIILIRNFLRKFVFLLNRQNDFVLQVSSFRVLLYFALFSDFSPFFPCLY